MTKAKKEREREKKRRPAEPEEEVDEFMKSFNATTFTIKLRGEDILAIIGAISIIRMAQMGDYGLKIPPEKSKFIHIIADICNQVGMTIEQLESRLGFGR